MLRGILTVGNGISRVNGIPLAICGADDPFGAATNFLAASGFGNGSQVVVDGSPGAVGNTPVFCMTGVHAAAAARAASVPTTKPGAVRKTARARRARKNVAKKTKAGAKKTRKPKSRKAAGRKGRKTNSRGKR